MIYDRTAHQNFHKLPVDRLISVEITKNLITGPSFRGRQDYCTEVIGDQPIGGRPSCISWVTGGRRREAAEVWWPVCIRRLQTWFLEVAAFSPIPPAQTTLCRGHCDAEPWSGSAAGCRPNTAGLGTGDTSLMETRYVKRSGNNSVI